MVGKAIRAEIQRGHRAARGMLRATILLRILMIASFAFAVCFAVDTPGSLAHEALEGSHSIATATAPTETVVSPAISKVPADTHGKTPLGAPCSGHCAGHTTGLLSAPLQAAAVVPALLQWARVEGHLTYRWSPFALERPPRV